MHPRNERAGAVLLAAGVLLAAVLRFELSPPAWLLWSVAGVLVLAGVVVLTDRRPPRSDPWGEEEIARRMKRELEAEGLRTDERSIAGPLVDQAAQELARIGKEAAREGRHEEEGR